MNELRLRRLVFGTLILVQVIFGIAFVVNKVVVTAFPPLVWASLRTSICAVLMMGFVVASGRPHPPAGRAFFGPLALFALLGMVINQAAFLVGLHHTTPTNAAILYTTIPIFTLVLVTVRGQEPLSVARAIGFFSAFVGVGILHNIEDFTLSNATFVGDLLILVNSLSYALFLTLGKGFFMRNDPVWCTAWMFVYGAPVLTLMALPDYRALNLPQMTPLLWGCAAYSIVLATLLTYFLNNWALSKTNSSYVALFICLQPIVEFGAVWAAMGEVVTPRKFLSSALIFVGLCLGLTLKHARISNTNREGHADARSRPA